MSVAWYLKGISSVVTHCLQYMVISTNKVPKWQKQNNALGKCEYTKLACTLLLSVAIVQPLDD